MRISIGLVFSLVALSACTSVLGEHAAEIHSDHAHAHGDECGHVKVWHADHWDYLHDGHLHALHDEHADEHILGVTAENPNGEAPLDPALHAAHAHVAEKDEHQMVRHGDHMDFIHDGRLHFVHGDHVDDHGPVTIKENG